MDQQFKGNFDLIEKNVYGCIEFHYKLAEQFGLFNAFGIFKIRVHDPSTTTEKSVGVKRRIHFFCIDHVNMPTYSKSYELSECSEVGAEVILDGPIDFSKSKARTFLEYKYKVSRNGLEAIQIIMLIPVIVHLCN